MKKHLLILLLIVMPFAMVPWGTARAHPCDSYLASPEAKNAGANKADVLAAYDFGLKIQDAIHKKDAALLLSLIKGELPYNGPRRSLIESQPFDAVFPADWQNAVLTGTPECRRTGWRGYMMAEGLIWYEKADSFPEKFTITSMNRLSDDKDLPNNDLPQGWSVDGKLIPPQCLPHPFLSEDNFESFADYYKFDTGAFEKEPGKFFGSSIKNLDYVPDDWAVGVIAPLDKCGDDADKPVVQEDGSVLSGQMPDAEGYKILGRLAPQECNKLIPDYPVKPEICYAINVTEYMSGTMREYNSNYIYGLIRGKDRTYILPLLSFKSRNDMIDYIEKHL